MTRVFNNNELRIACDVATRDNISISQALKQLNAQYGVQRWEHIMSLTPTQCVHLRTIATQCNRPIHSIANELRAQYGALWGKKLQNLARGTE